MEEFCLITSSFLFIIFFSRLFSVIKSRQALCWAPMSTVGNNTGLLSVEEMWINDLYQGVVTFLHPSSPTTQHKGDYSLSSPFLPPRPGESGGAFRRNVNSLSSRFMGKAGPRVAGKTRTHLHWSSQWRLVPVHNAGVATAAANEDRGDHSLGRDSEDHTCLNI